MTTQNTTTTYNQKFTVLAAEVVYTVTDRRGHKRVAVSMTGAYECNCDAFVLYGECKHVDAVKAERKAQGRKF